jgi:hypothetical protein
MQTEHPQAQEFSSCFDFFFGLFQKPVPGGAESTLLAVFGGNVLERCPEGTTSVHLPLVGMSVEIA